MGTGEPVRLVLYLSKGYFEIEPGPAGEPLRVQADYDAARFKLEEIYDESDRRYEVRFDSRHGWASLIGHHENLNRVKVIVPRGYPLTIEGKIAMGESHVELGGLHLTEINLDLGIGDDSLSFAEPTTATLERLEIDGSMGELTTSTRWATPARDGCASATRWASSTPTSPARGATTPRSRCVAAWASAGCARRTA